MKRIGILASIAALFLACVVPAGAYQWNGESFLDDYYGVTPLDVEFDVGHFELRSFDGARITVSGDYSGSYTVGKPSQTTNDSATRLFYGIERVFVMRNLSIAPFGSFVWEYSYESCVFDFVFDVPVDSFQLDGLLLAYVDGGGSFWNASNAPLNAGISCFSTVEIIVNEEVIKSFPGVSSSALDVSSVSYQSDTPIDSFSIRLIFDRSDTLSRTDVYFRGYSFSVFLSTRTSDPLTITVVPHDPDGPGPGPVVPGEGDFEYTEISGEELAQDVVLGPSVTTGGANVYWTYDSYTTGVPPYEVTVPGGSAHQMAPSRLGAIVDGVGVILNAIVSFFKGLISLFSLIASSMSFVTTLFSSIPSVLLVFASAAIGVVIVLHMIGR